MTHANNIKKNDFLSDGFLDICVTACYYIISVKIFRLLNQAKSDLSCI